MRSHTYLAELKPGDRLPLAVRPSNAAFHLPGHPSVPLVMFCAGSGLAPFMGFVQEHAAQKMAGRVVVKMLLFFGCTDPEVDYSYAREEMGEWVREHTFEITSEIEHIALIIVLFILWRRLASVIDRWSQYCEVT